MPTPNNASVITTPMPSSGNAPAPAPSDDEAAKAAALAAEAANPNPDDTVTPNPDDGTPAAVTNPDDAPASLELTAEPEAVKANGTGNDQFDAVANMLAEKGVANVDAIMDSFLDSGEFTLENKATMIEALGESVASMAFNQMESIANTMIADAKAESAASMDYANKLFGQDGKQDAATTWEQIQAYARSEDSGFSEADLATMNTMLEAGGFQAQLVIDKVHSAYNADANVSVPGTLLEGDSAANGLTFEPISRADYTVAMGKAVREHGEDSPQVRDLDKRRTQSMSRGY